MVLAKIIQGLIDSKKEGDYWDFKKERHDNPVDLVKDVICLSNTMRHKGDRYLIFGVDDAKYRVVGIQDIGRKTQADIISIF